MAKTFIGGLVAGIILFVTGFIFWGTPLGEIPFSTAGDAQNAAVQTALAQNLTQSGTGTYIIPAHQSAPGAVLYAQGPIATVHFNTMGFSPDDMSMLLPGFIFAIVSGLLIAFGLGAVSRGKHFADLAQLVVLFSIGVTAWTLLAQPVFNHFGWGYWIYSFIAETTALILAGLVVARWFVPRDHVGQAAPAAPAAPVSSEPEAG
jgi:hypothetical protein